MSLDQHRKDPVVLDGNHSCVSLRHRQFMSGARTLIITMLGRDWDTGELWSQTGNVSYDVVSAGGDERHGPNCESH